MLITNLHRQFLTKKTPYELKLYFYGEIHCDTSFQSFDTECFPQEYDFEICSTVVYEGYLNHVYEKQTIQKNTLRLICVVIGENCEV